MDTDEQKNDVITLVLTADNHLGATIPGHAPRKREVFRQRLRQAFQQATDFAIGQGVDLFVQVGDLFDNTHPDEQDRNFVAARLAELKQAGVRAFALGGTHDTPSESRNQRGDMLPAPHVSFARLGALHYFPPQPEDAPEQEGALRTLRPVLLDVRGTLVGLCGLGNGSIGSQHDQSDPLAGVRIDDEIERAALPLLLLSAPIEGTHPATSTGSQQVSQASIAAQDAFRVILAGYAHRYQRLTIGQAEVVIAGATQHVEFDEHEGTNSSDEPDGANDSNNSDSSDRSADAPGFVFLGVAADGIRWCRHIDIESISMRRLVISTADLWPQGEHAGNAENAASAASPTERILEQLRPLCTQETIVQVRLEGELSRQQYHQLETNAIRRYGEAHAFAFLLDDSALTFTFDDDGGEPVSSRLVAAGFEERLSPREELIALADEWIAGAQDEQEKSALLATKEELLSALWSTAKA